MLSRVAALLAVSLVFSSAALAQAVGAEFEFDEVFATGDFSTCFCGQVFHGPGTDWNPRAALLFEMPIAHESFVWFSVGNSRLSAQYSMNAPDTVAVVEGYEMDTVTGLRVKNVGNWRADYLQLSTAFGTRVFFGMEAYLGVGIQFLEASHQHFERQLVDGPPATRFGSTGTTTEVVIDDDLASDNIHQLHTTGLIGLQYRWNDWSPIVLIPKIEAEIDLSPVFQSTNSGIKTTNVGAGLAVLYSF